MGTILVILILLLVWFYMIVPFLKIYRAVNKAQKNVRDFQQRQQQQRQQPRQPEPTKKKIDPTVGEYVQFTEVTEERTTPEGDTVTTAEQQITDVTWEDL